MTYLATIGLLVGLSFSAAAANHPHGPDSEVYFSGALKSVDLEAGTLVVDAVDPRTFARDNVRVFLRKDVTVRQGKRRLSVADLEPGQRLTIIGEREDDQDGRIVASDIQVTPRRR